MMESGCDLKMGPALYCKQSQTGGGSSRVRVN